MRDFVMKNSVTNVAGNRGFYSLSIRDNGATYTPLGDATPSRPVAAPNYAAPGLAPSSPQTSGYNLTGLNLPTGQNILIRARGYYRTGFNNGSETILKATQIAFLTSPTAAGVSGYVLTQPGRAPRGATVTLTDLFGQAQTTTVNRFGHYSFTDVAAGQTYFVTVTAKGYNFTPPTAVVTPGFDVENLDFTAFAGR